MTQVSESLAGRFAIVELAPLLLLELTTDASAKRLWLTGGFPDGGVLRPGPYPTWQIDYLRLLVQRDLPSWGLPARPQVTERLLRMLAAVNGQMWNASRIGQSLGLSYHTVNGYLDYLEGAFLVRRLPAHHANLKKRLVKSPKVYWRDSGLLHALLNVPDQAALLHQPWVGASWEGFVVNQVLGHLAARGIPHGAAYLRTSDQYEIDLLLELAGRTWAIEIKLTTSPSPSDMARLDRAADLVGADHRTLLSQVRTPAGDARRASANLEWLLDRLDEV
jgi:predicted AAA+ superfamily ATPase